MQNFTSQLSIFPLYTIFRLEYGTVVFLFSILLQVLDTINETIAKIENSMETSRNVQNCLMNFNCQYMMIKEENDNKIIYIQFPYTCKVMIKKTYWNNTVVHWNKLCTVETSWLRYSGYNRIERKLKGRIVCREEDIWQIKFKI